MKKLLNWIGLIAVSLQKNGLFSLGDFDHDDHIMTMDFSSRTAHRIVIINKETGYLIFKGSTLKDLKWVCELSKIDYFQIGEDGMLRVKFKNGRVFSFGGVPESFEQVLEKHIGGLYQKNI